MADYGIKSEIDWILGKEYLEIVEKGSKGSVFSEVNFLCPRW